MDILEGIKKDIAKKIAYKFITETIGSADIKNVNVSMEKENVEISFEGNVSIPRDELVKLIFND